MEAIWTDLVSESAPDLPTALPSACVGSVAVADAEEGLWVMFAGAPGRAPVAARTTVPVTPADKDRYVLLVFEDGDAERPIVTGFIQAQPVVPLEGIQARTARLDGRQVRLEAEREIVLQCGRSSLTLRADGKVVLKGVEIVSRARRTNKVKGGTVRIN